MASTSLFLYSESPGKNVYVPVWHVAIETSDKVVQIESVNAFSNTIVTNNTVPKVEDQ